jgi:hypothetical protein
MSVVVVAVTTVTLLWGNVTCSVSNRTGKNVQCFHWHLWYGDFGFHQMVIVPTDNVSSYATIWCWHSLKIFLIDIINTGFGTNGNKTVMLANATSASILKYSTEKLLSALRTLLKWVRVSVANNSLTFVCKVYRMKHKAITNLVWKRQNEKWPQRLPGFAVHSAQYTFTCI